METTTIVIDIALEFGEQLCNPGDGDRLYEIMKDILDSGNKVVLDFSGVRMIWHGFFNHSIGRFIKYMTKEQFMERVSAVNIYPYDRHIYNRVLDNAVEYFARQADYHDSSVTSLLDGVKE